MPKQERLKQAGKFSKTENSRRDYFKGSKKHSEGRKILEVAGRDSGGSNLGNRKTSEAGNFNLKS